MEKRGYLTRGQAIVQLGYMVTFLFSSMCIAGSLDINETIPVTGLIINFVSGFLTAGKLLYWYKKGRLF